MNKIKRKINKCFEKYHIIFSIQSAIQQSTKKVSIGLVQIKFETKCRLRAPSVVKLITKPSTGKRTFGT